LYLLCRLEESLGENDGRMMLPFLVFPQSRLFSRSSLFFLRCKRIFLGFFPAVLVIDNWAVSLNNGDFQRRAKNAAKSKKVMQSIDFVP
jgi:hypothetical protein